MSVRSTRAEVQRRVHAVLKLRLGGAEFLDLREYADAPEQSWGVSDTQLRRYIAAADKLCVEYFDAKAEHLLSRHLLQRRTLYAHAMSAGDWRTALAVLQDEARLESLYPPTKTALTDPTGTKPAPALVLNIVEEILDTPPGEEGPAAPGSGGLPPE